MGYGLGSRGGGYVMLVECVDWFGVFIVLVLCFDRIWVFRWG